MTIHLIELESAHFQFQAFGATLEDATQAMRDALEVHCRDYPDADMDYLRWLLENDANVMEVSVPGALRDGEVIA